MSIIIGNNQIEMHIANHPYKSFIRKLLCFGEGGSQLRNVGMSIVNNNKTVYDSDYKASTERLSWTAESCNLEMKGRMDGIYFFNSPAYLLPGVPIKIRMRRSHPSFYVLQSEVTKENDYYFEIKDIRMFVPSLQTTPMLNPLLEMCTDKHPAKYPFSLLNMRRFSISKGIITKTFRRIFQNKLPQKLCFGFYSQDAFSGSKTLGPLLAYNLDVRKFIVYINGIAVRIFTQNYSEGIYMQTYKKFLDWMRVEKGSNYFIDYNTFKNGYRFLCVDFLENCSNCENAPILQGEIDCEINLGKSTDTELIMCVFSLSNEEVLIDKTRDVKYYPNVT